MKYITKYSLILVIAILIILFAFLNPVFVSPSNLLNLVDQVSIIGIVALGMTVVILSGGIDLSVGSIVAFSGIILAMCLARNIPVFFSMIICLGTGIGLGLINGFFIAYGRVPAFISTLGLMSIGRGAALYITSGKSVSDFPGQLQAFVTGSIVHIPVSIVVFIGFGLLLLIFLKFTYWGKYIYAIGGNEKAAWLSGIDVKSYKLLVYAISGLASAIAAMLLVGKLGSAQPQAGNMYELNAIAAVVIGGASLSGGKGSVEKTFLGILILGILQNGFSILNIASFYQQILVGFVIIFAVIADSKSFKIKRYEKS